MSGMKIERDARVLASDGEVGRVTHVIVDRETREVTEIVVEHDGQERLLPIGAVASADGDTVRLRGDLRQVPLTDGFRRDEFHGVDDETADAQNRGRAERGGAALRDAQDDAVTIAGVPGGTADAGHLVRRQPTATEELAVPVAEERLQVEKRQAELGAVELHKRVVEEQVSVPVELSREEVRVYRHDVADRPVRPGEAVFDGGVTRVPVRGEDAIVTKEAVITGEVVVDKERVVEREQVTDTVRKEQVEVERSDRAGQSRTRGRGSKRNG